MTESIAEQFREAMAAYGIVTRFSIIADGKLHRFYVEGDKKGRRNGWYVLYANDIPAGAFGSWRSGVSESWCSKQLRSMNPMERQRYKQLMNAAHKTQEGERNAAYANARTKAAHIWQEAQSATLDHPYLLKKGVKNHGLRMGRGCLIVPLRDSAGMLHSLQFIDAMGEKRFLSGGRMKGCYFAIGTPSGTICIAEGYATAASIYEATGHAIAVAFNAGNIEAVGKALREKFPAAKIIICADDDSENAINTGVISARKAASAIGAYLAIPGGNHG